jgi:hypothetical protein
VLATYTALLARIGSGESPGAVRYRLACGRRTRGTRRPYRGGSGVRIATAFDRVELISDALTAILARQAGLAVVTEDRDFDVLAQLVPGLNVLFYDRHRAG